MLGCRDGHFVFASRLGSLSTVFTWLRSRACAGMQGLGVLALVVVAPCGFAAHVVYEEAVLSSPRNRCTSKIRRKLRNLLRPWGPCPYLQKTRNVKNRQVAKFAQSLGPVPLPPTPPEPKPLDPPPRALAPPPPHRASFKKRHFSSFCAHQKYDASCEICSVPGARA